MKVRIHIIFLLMVALGGCAKSDTDPVIMVQDVVFRIKKNNAQRENTDFQPLSPNYARIIIDDNRYNVAITGEGENYITEPFRMVVGSHKVNLVLLLNNNNTADYTADDIVVLATPAVGSGFNNYVAKPTAFDFTLTGSRAPVLDVEVLYYTAKNNKEFGITFNIEEIIIREQCFFGDICVSDPKEYAGSLYEGQENGIRVDVPAIFYIEVSRNNKPVLGSPFSNDEWLGEGSPLCIQYPDNLNIKGEVFAFKLYVLGPNERGGFSYNYCYTWTVTDDEMLSSGTDGVVDFVLGNCVYTPSDIIINPKQYNMETAFAYSGIEEDCFLNYGFGRWGWVIGPFYPLDNLDASYDLYAVASRCNPDNGLKVGKAEFHFEMKSVRVTYILDEPYILSEVHVYIGNLMFPALPNGSPTVSPGSYGNSVNFSPGENINYYQRTVEVPNPNLGFYIIAHAVVGIPD